MAKLVDAIHILSSSSMTHNEINIAEYLLSSFVNEFEELYGESNMVYNVHQLKHLTDCVRHNGPVFAYSNYSMEDNIGHMISNVQGTTDVSSQICSKYILEKELINYLKKSQRAQDFYNRIERKLHFPIAQKVNGTLVIGKALTNDSKNMSDHEMQLVRTVLNIDEICEFNSIHLNCKIFHETVSNSSTKRTNDSFIFNVKSKRFADIKSIFLSDGQLYLLIDEKYESHQNGACKYVIFLTELDSYEQKIIKPTSIGSKYVLIKYKNSLACSSFPNFYEKN